MVEVVLALYLGSEVSAAALIEGLHFLTGLKDRAALAFTHAKARTVRLSEAAEYANNFIQLFEGTVEELQSRVDGRRRPLLVAPLRKLQQAVTKATALMEDLESRSAAMWFVYGKTFREKITEATTHLETACRDLAQVLTGAHVEVSLSIRQQVEQLANEMTHFLAGQQNNEEQDADAVAESWLTARDMRELLSIMMAEQSRFTTRAALSIQRTSAHADKFVHELCNANEQYQTSSLLVTTVRSTYVIHGEVRARAARLGPRGAWEQLRGGINKAFAMIDTARGNEPVKRKTMIPFALAVVEQPLIAFQDALEFFEAACKGLATDRPALTVVLQNTITQFKASSGNFPAALDAVLEAYANDPGTDKTKLTDYFSEAFDELMRDVAAVVMAERKHILIKAHQFLHSTNFHCDADLPPSSPTEGAHSPASGNTEMNSSTLQYPDLLDTASNQLEGLIERAKSHTDKFFERHGNTLRFRIEPKHEHIHALLLDLEKLDVFVRGSQMKATTQLGLQMLGSLRGLADVLAVAAQSITAPGPTLDLSGLHQQLDAIRTATEALMTKEGLLNTSTISSVVEAVQYEL